MTARAWFIFGASLVLTALTASGWWLSHPPDLSALQDTSRSLHAQDGQLLQVRLNSAGKWREPVSIAEIDPNLIAALIAFEDQRFDRHKGVDAFALARAGLSLVRERRIVSGGSTLTMQLARLLYPDLRSGGLAAKARQIAAALKLEWHLQKSEILEAYFTLAPYGGHIEGVKAATRAWFQTDPAHLTFSQIGVLVALPQSPERRRPDRFPGAALAAKNRVLTTIAPRLGIGTQALRDYESEGLQMQFHRPPSLAQHALDRLRDKDRHKGTAPPLVTSLNGDWQRVLGDLLAHEVRAHAAPINAAALIVERRTGLVRAYQGSAGYLDRDRKGGNNFLTSVRSPGSLLKPLIYALALDRRLIAHDHVFRDQRLQVAGYAPSNFDGAFVGDITLAEALVTSRNIPAIETLRLLGSGAVARQIEGLLGRRDPQYLDQGLSLAVGGFSLSGEELAALYLALVDPGTARALRFEVGDGALPVTDPLLSPETTQTLLGLMAVPRADGRGYRVAKTGTSQHRQDAHAMVVTQNHLIYTWLGTPDNERSEHLTGASAALPLAERIQSALNLPPPRLAAQPKLAAPLPLPASTCPPLILVPEDGDWLRAPTRRVFVDLPYPSTNLYLNGHPADLAGQSLLVPMPGAHSLSANAKGCRQTINFYVE